MTPQFHRPLNRMSFFTALLVALLLLFYPEFLSVASSNIWLNGVILGTTIFGIGLCFAEMFRLLPEYKWLHGFITRRRGSPALPPRLLRPVALMLHAKPKQISATTLNNMLDGQNITVESWLQDFAGDLYGKAITLEFYRFLRPEKKFDTLSALQAEIQKNALQVRKIFEKS